MAERSSGNSVVDAAEFVDAGGTDTGCEVA